MNEKNGNNPADQQMVEQVLRGNSNAFAAVIKNTEALVAQIVFKMIDNAEERKDIAQDVYLKAFNKLSGFKFQSKLSTWIGRIAYNTCLSYLEKKKLIFPDHIYDEYENAGDALEILSAKSTITFINEPENMLSKKEISEILKNEIEKLSPVYKTLITLYHNEEMSYAEISEITQLPEGTVKSYLSRARKTLKENLLTQYKKEEL